MLFTETDTTENFPLRRFVSVPDGVWECGLLPMLFGVRIRLGRVGYGWCVVDYCAGPEWFWQQLLLGVVIGRLIETPEKAPESTVAALYPQQTIKPMSEDKECWKKLVGPAYQESPSVAESEDPAP